MQAAQRMSCQLALQHDAAPLFTLHLFCSDPSGVSSSTITVADVRNKLVAGSLTLPHVRHVACINGQVAALLGSGVLVVASEVPLPAQLDALFKRSLYKLAADLATGGCRLPLPPWMMRGSGQFGMPAKHLLWLFY